MLLIYLVHALLSSLLIMSHFTVQAATLKKIKIHVETLHSTKMKEEKASKGGKKGGKARSTVKMDLQKVSYIILKKPLHCTTKTFREFIFELKSCQNCKENCILYVCACSASAHYGCEKLNFYCFSIFAWNQFGAISNNSLSNHIFIHIPFRTFSVAQVVAVVLMTNMMTLCENKWSIVWYIFPTLKAGLFLTLAQKLLKKNATHEIELMKKWSVVP